MLQGSAAILSVGRGNFTLPEDAVSVSTRVRQAECPIGYFCVEGLRYACIAGRYGNTTGLATSSCTGNSPVSALDAIVAVVEFAVAVAVVAAGGVVALLLLLLLLLLLCCCCCCC